MGYILDPNRAPCKGRRIKITRSLLIAAAVILPVLTGCNTAQPQPVPVRTAGVTSPSELPNPASVYCEEQGYSLEIRTATDGSQSGVCIFPDGSECDEWAYFRGQCGPAGQNAPGTGPTAIATPHSIDPGGYQGWWTYTHTSYGFSIMLPPDWVAEEVTSSDPLMNGHTLSLHPAPMQGLNQTQNVRMTFRRVGEEARLWPTGVGQGEFIPQGTLDVAGGSALRVLLVCPRGEVTSIWYHQAEGQPNITRGDLEFGFIFSAGDHCEPGKSLEGKMQLAGEMIIASLNIP